jgi:hypothetical protein
LCRCNNEKCRAGLESGFGVYKFEIKDKEGQKPVTRQAVRETEADRNDETPKIEG